VIEFTGVLRTTELGSSVFSSSYTDSSVGWLLLAWRDRMEQILQRLIRVKVTCVLGRAVLTARVALVALYKILTLALKYI